MKPHDPHSHIPFNSDICALFASNNGWIFYCGAIETMMIDPNGLISTAPTTQTYIQTANRECVGVDQAGTVDISHLFS